MVKTSASLAAVIEICCIALPQASDSTLLKSDSVQITRFSLTYQN